VHAELTAPQEFSTRYGGLLARGYYIDQVAHLLKYYPSARAHVIVFEDWSHEPSKLDDLVDFLGLARTPLGLEAPHRRSYTEPLDLEMRIVLHEHFRPL